MAFLQALQRWLAACLDSGTMPWSVRAPTLLLIGVIGSTAPEGNGLPQPQPLPSSPSSSSSPLQVSHQALRNQLQRRPSADLLLDSPGAVSDLCSAVELVLERLAVRGDWQAYVGLLAALLAALGGAASELCDRAAAAQGIPPCRALTLAAAATQEAAAAALAALHATWRQVGSTCARTAAAVVSSPAAASSGRAAGALPTALAAARTVAGQAGPRPAASEALASIAASLHAAVAAAAPTATAPGGIPAGSSADPLAGNLKAGRPGPQGPGPLSVSSRPGAAASRTHTVADPSVTLAVTAAAAGGLLEGCTTAVRLQPLGRAQELLLRLLEPAVGLLSGALQESAAAASAAAAAASAAAPHLAAAAPGSGVAWSACSVDADPRVFLLSAAVGYGWVRLWAQTPLPGPLQPARHTADQMAAAAAAAAVQAATAAAAGRQGSGCCWHPSRGALAVLMLGSLGVGRALQLAAEGGSPDSAAELLEGQSRGLLFADTQLLAKGIVEALRAPVPAAGPGPALTGSAAAVGAAGALLADAVAAARRLNLLYGSVADSAEGRGWLAALPSLATGTLREVLDRAFVCEISVLAVAYDVLSSLGSAASGPELPTPTAGSVPAGVDAAAGSGGAGQGQGLGSAVLRAPATVAAAAAALGALADLQFCALQLRAHGDLVARLSADAVAAPAAALPSLLALLPCYTAFAANYAGGFAAMPVAASRLAFLLPLASSCVPHAANVSAAASAVLPYTYLLLKGAPESVVQAAHATWATLLAGLCEESAGEADAGGRGRVQPADQRGVGARQTRTAAATAASGQRYDRVAVAASMVPFYIERTCQEPVSVDDLELLEWGVRQVLQVLPEAHPMKAWCTARLVRQLIGWAVASADGAVEAAALKHCEAPTRTEAQLWGEPRAAGWKSPTDAGRGASIEVVRRSAVAVGMAVVMLDFSLLTPALETLDASLADVRPDRAALIVQQLHDVWLSSNDYARKQLLEKWLHRSFMKLYIAAQL